MREASDFNHARPAFWASEFRELGRSRKRPDIGTKSLSPLSYFNSDALFTSEIETSEFDVARRGPREGVIDYPRSHFPNGRAGRGAYRFGLRFARADPSERR